MSDTRFLITAEVPDDAYTIRFGSYLPGPFDMLSSAKLSLSLARCGSLVMCTLPGH